MITEKVNKDSVVFLYTTCASREEASSLGLSAIKEHLAVCADFWAISSIYPWQNSIEEVDQYILMLTTNKTLSDKLQKFIEGLHSYSVPMIAILHVAFMNPSYSFWINRTLNDTEDFKEFDTNKENSDDGYIPGKLK